MNIEFSLKDINGEELELGDLVWVYNQDYEEVGREEDEDGTVVEIDITRPRPVADIPVFIGKLVWQEDLYQLDLEIVTRIDRNYEGVGSVSLGIGFALEKLKEGGDASCPQISSTII